MTCYDPSFVEELKELPEKVPQKAKMREAE
jgi:hypothetical protein